MPLLWPFYNHAFVQLQCKYNLIHFPFNLVYLTLTNRQSYNAVNQTVSKPKQP